MTERQTRNVLSSYGGREEVGDTNRAVSFVYGRADEQGLLANADRHPMWVGIDAGA